MKDQTAKRRPKPLNKASSTRKDRAADRLFKAVAHWLDVHGGRALVAGGIEIQQWPTDPDYTFRVGVRVTGRKPVKDAHAD